MYKELSLLVLRKKESFYYKVNPALNSYANNWKNNSIDDLVILKSGVALQTFKCQTVANHPDYDPNDTIADGLFELKCFVEPRLFHGEIHAIINTVDVDGEGIDHRAMQTTKDGYQTGRWLIHDRYSFKTKCDSNYAWSAGCIITASKALAEFNSILKEQDITPGTILMGEIKTI